MAATSRTVPFVSLMLIEGMQCECSSSSAISSFVQAVREGAITADMLNRAQGLDAGTKQILTHENNTNQIDEERPNEKTQNTAAVMGGVWVEKQDENGDNYEELKHSFRNFDAAFQLRFPYEDGAAPNILCVCESAMFPKSDQFNGAFDGDAINIDTAKQLVAETIRFLGNADFDIRIFNNYFIDQLEQSYEKNISPLCGDYEDGIWLGEKLQKASFDEYTDDGLKFLDKDKLYYVQRTGDACDIKTVDAKKAEIYVEQYMLTGKDDHLQKLEETLKNDKAFEYSNGSAISSFVQAVREGVIIVEDGINRIDEKRPNEKTQNAAAGMGGVWVKKNGNDYEELNHNFSGLDVSFHISSCESHSVVHFLDGKNCLVSNVFDDDTGKQLVAKTIEHFDGIKIPNATHLSAYFDNLQKTEIAENIKPLALPEPRQALPKDERLQKIGYVQGVCECVAAIGGAFDMAKKLLVEMNVTKEMSQKYARPDTFKALEQGVFAPKPEQKLEQAQSLKR